MNLDRTCVPPPHVAEHVPHVVHVLQVQLIASHEVISQGADATDSPLQGIPPFCAVFSTYLDFSCMPPPHVAEHAPHEVHEAHVQFTKLSSTQGVVPDPTEVEVLVIVVMALVIVVIVLVVMVVAAKSA